jgi:Asp-tRNA(Asn)/Glu-tRNA(Gln) amidotransferase A subunit family amidase
MTRSVADAAAILGVIAGNDPSDPKSARGRDHIPADGYTAFLKADALRGARIGVLRQLSDTPTTDPEVLRRFEEALQTMENRGAVLIDPAILPGADELAQRTPRECRPFREALSVYLTTLDPNAPVRSLSEIITSGKFLPSLEARFRMYQEAKRPEDNPDCRTAELQVERLRARVQELLLNQRLDVLVYPSWNNPPRLLGDMNTPHGSNGPRIASVVGFPAITVPMGWVRDATLPVGLEFLGDEWSEPRLIEIAYAYEQATRHRKPAASVPPLSHN